MLTHQVEELLSRRSVFRQHKDFAQADAVMRELNDMGVLVFDKEMKWFVQARTAKALAGGAQGGTAAAAAAVAANLGGVAALPPGWVAAADPASGRTYYVDTARGVTQWHPPAMPKPVLPPPPPPQPRPPLPLPASAGFVIPTPPAGYEYGAQYGALPAYSALPDGMPPGSMPPGSMPPGSMPPGSMPSAESEMTMAQLGALPDTAPEHDETAAAEERARQIWKAQEEEEAAQDGAPKKEVPRSAAFLDEAEAAAVESTRKRKAEEEEEEAKYQQKVGEPRDPYLGVPLITTECPQGSIFGGALERP